METGKPKNPGGRCKIHEWSLARPHFRSNYSANPSEPCDHAVCIPMTKGLHALIDSEDYERVSEFRWTTGVYNYAANYNVRRGRIILHRLVMNTPHGLSTDHINGNTLDNRKQNLRICTHAQNTYNRGKANKATSIYKGVSFSTGHQRYVAVIKINRKSIHIGNFVSEDDAATAYNFMAERLHGEFARFNTPEGCPA